MTAKMLSIIIPAYQEEQNLAVLLPDIKTVLDGCGIAWEILVMDSMTSLDNTASVCRANGATCINRSGGNTYGDAVRSGLSAATGELIIFMDADGSHTPSFIPQLLSHAADSDVVIASRYVGNGGSHNSLPLILMSRVLNTTYSLVLGIPCKDVSNSFKLYHAADVKNLRLRCLNFDIVEEILLKVCRAKHPARITELPYYFRNRLFGKTKRNLFIFILTYLVTMLRLRFSADDTPRKG